MFTSKVCVDDRGEKYEKVGLTGQSGSSGSLPTGPGPYPYLPYRSCVRFRPQSRIIFVDCHLRSDLPLRSLRSDYLYLPWGVSVSTTSPSSLCPSPEASVPFTDVYSGPSSRYILRYRPLFFRLMRLSYLLLRRDTTYSLPLLCLYELWLLQTPDIDVFSFPSICPSDAWGLLPRVSIDLLPTDPTLTFNFWNSFYFWNKYVWKDPSLLRINVQNKNRGWISTTKHEVTLSGTTNIRLLSCRFSAGDIPLFLSVYSTLPVCLFLINIHLIHRYFNVVLISWDSR